MTSGQPKPLAPLVTIVTPSYNQGRFIGDTIESVLAQDYPRIEYIIMDGASTDETAEVARRYAGKLEFISERDRGQSHAINKGFQRARGEIVAWLNSDDTLLPGAVSRAVAALEAHPEAAASYGEGYLMDEAGHVTCRFPHTQPFDYWRLANVSDYILQQSLFFRRSALEAIGWVREDLHYVMDWDLLIRLAKRWPLHYEPAYFGCLREHGAAKTASGGPRRVSEIASVLRQHTGTRWPMGLLVYGIDTYAGMARQAVAKWPWSEHFQTLITDTMNAAMGIVFSRQPGGYERRGWHGDGPCERNMRFSLPAATGTLILEGGVPDTAWLRGQRLEVLVNGERLASAPVENRFRLELPVAGRHSQRLLLEVNASLEITPGFDAPHIEGSRRRIAFRLDRIIWDGWEYLPDGTARETGEAGRAHSD